MYKYPILPFIITGLLLITISSVLTPVAKANNSTVTVSNVQIRNIGYTSATITWTTDSASNSQIRYGKSSIDEFSAGANNVSDINHSVTLLSLTPATRYIFQVTSATHSGASGSSQELTFETLSFSFDDSNIGNFAELNATPTPTPFINPYAQSLPPNYTIPQHYGGYSQPPVYLVPPVIYPQTQTTTSGQTLGAQQDTTAVAVPTVTANNELTSLVQTGLWGGIALLFIILLCFGLIILQFQKSRKEMRILQKQLRRSNQRELQHQEPKKQPKTYSFDVG